MLVVHRGYQRIELIRNIFFSRHHVFQLNPFYIRSNPLNTSSCCTDCQATFSARPTHLWLRFSDRR